MKVGDTVYMIGERPFAEWGYSPEDGSFIPPYYPLRGVIANIKDNKYVIHVSEHFYRTLEEDSLFPSEERRNADLCRLSAIAEEIYDKAVQSAYKEIKRSSLTKSVIAINRQPR
jgi:hypothetical protein